MNNNTAKEILAKALKDLLLKEPCKKADRSKKNIDKMNKDIKLNKKLKDDAKREKIGKSLYKDFIKSNKLKI